MIGNQILKRQWIPSLINVVFQTLELPLFLISFCRDLRAFLLLAKAASTASRILLSSTICHKPRAVSRDNWAMHPTHSGENRSIFLEESLAPNSLCCTWRLLKSGNTEAKSSIIHHKWMGQKWQKNWQTHCFIPMLSRGCLAPLWRFSVPRERSGEAWNVWWCLWTLIANGMSQGCMKSL